MAGSITIIGAGIAGLAAGCYARMNGYRARIYEQHSLPGGLCASWRRKGYLADGCIEWLCGSGPGMSLHQLWEELGAMEDLTYVHHPAHIHLELPGLNFVLPTDADEMEAYLMAMAPEDHAWICELTQAVRDFGRFADNGSPEASTPEAQQYMGRWLSTSMGDFVSGIQNPQLKQALGTLWGGPMPVFFGLLPLGYAHRRSAGYPVGGSLMFARAIEQRFIELGGEIHYNAPVKQILVEELPDGTGCRAVGLELVDGIQVWEREGDIISCADARLTIFDLLGGQFADDNIRRWFDHIPVIGSPLMVNLGVALPLKMEPSAIGGILMPPAEPVHLYGEEVKLLNVHVYDYDPTAAPEGKSVVRVNMWGNYPFWKELKKDTAAYEAEKERLATEVITALDHRFPGLAEHVEMIDVATPLTFERYTSNWQGSSQGWVPTAEAAQWSQEAAISDSWPASRRLPGLEHFYMSGQWMETFGGLPTAAHSSRSLIETLCARDGLTFTTSKPGENERERGDKLF